MTLFFQLGLSAESKDYSVISLSAAIIDHFFLISEEQLRSITLEKGNWVPIDYPTLCSILECNPNLAKMVPGGSGANVMKGLAQLGESCAIVVKVGSDDKGEFYIQSMTEIGVEFFLEKGSLPTGQSICLITGV